MVGNLAVADLKHRFLGKELVEALTAPTPTDYIWERQGRGVGRVNYIPGHFFVERMNECLGFLWSTDIPEWIRDGDHIVEKVVVSINFPGTYRKTTWPDGRVEEVRTDPITIKKTQWGSSEVKRYDKETKNHKKGDLLDLGDDFKGAGTDGFKKCCTLLGIGLDVYGSRVAIDEDSRVQPVNETQLEALYIRAQKLDLSKDEARKMIREKEGADPEELPGPVVMKWISEFIKMGKKS